MQHQAHGLFCSICQHLQVSKSHSCVCYANNSKAQESQDGAPGLGKLEAMSDTYRSELRQEGQPSQVLTEEAALVRALHLSLMEVQHQEQGHVAGVGAAEPAVAASTALQDTVPQDMQSMAPE